MWWGAKEADGGDFPQKGEDSAAALAGEWNGFGKLGGRFADLT